MFASLQLLSCRGLLFSNTIAYRASKKKELAREAKWATEAGKGKGRRNYCALYIGGNSWSTI